MPAPALRTTGLSKRFGATVALDSVTLEVRRGEVHALVGENGSGKSTLAAIVAGDPVIGETGGFEGAVEVAGRPVRFGSPGEALASGVGLVHQELSLVAEMSVADNICLGTEQSRSRWPLAPLDHAAMRDTATRVLEHLKATVDPDARVADLPMGTRQLVEAGRQFARTKLALLVLDEPSAALSTREAESVQRMARAAAEAGAGVLFVSHRLDEVLATADRVTVLRDGRVIATVASADVGIDDLAALMVGRDKAPRIRLDRPVPGAPGLDLSDFTVDMPGDMVRGLQLQVRAGEVVGLTGLAGHGRLAVLSGLAGLFPARGVVRVAGQEVEPGDVRQAQDAGLVIVHEDRRETGLALMESIALNICWPLAIAGKGFSRAGRLIPGGGFLDDRAMVRAGQRFIEQLDIRCVSPDQPVGELSGGNQQKVALARALIQQPCVLAVAEPTRGIDIAAKERVLALLGDVAAQGVGVLVVSGEVGELERLCDRVLVVRDGCVAAEFVPPYDRVALELAITAGGRP